MAAPLAPGAGSGPLLDDEEDTPIGVLFAKESNPVQEYWRQMDSSVLDEGVYSLGETGTRFVVQHASYVRVAYRIFLGYVEMKLSRDRSDITVRDDDPFSPRPGIPQPIDEPHKFTLAALIRVLDYASTRPVLTTADNPLTVQTLRAHYTNQLESLRLSAEEWTRREAEKGLPLLDQHLLPDLANLVSETLTGRQPARQTSQSSSKGCSSLKL